MCRYDIIHQCWRVGPKDRPTFSELRAKFDSLILAQKDSMPYIDLDIDSNHPYYDHLSVKVVEHRASLASLNHADQTNLACSISSSHALGLEDTSNIPEPVPNPYVDTPAISVSSKLTKGIQDKCERDDNWWNERRYMYVYMTYAFWLLLLKVFRVPHFVTFFLWRMQVSFTSCH